MRACRKYARPSMMWKTHAPNCGCEANSDRLIRCDGMRGINNMAPSRMMRPLPPRHSPRSRNGRSSKPLGAKVRESAAMIPARAGAAKNSRSAVCALARLLSKRSKSPRLVWNSWQTIRARRFHINRWGAPIPTASPPLAYDNLARHCRDRPLRSVAA